MNARSTGDLGWGSWGVGAAFRLLELIPLADKFVVNREILPSVEP
jgi:hypothetical protein